MTEVVDSMVTLLLARLVPGETPITIESRYMNMTLASTSPDKLLSEPLTLGDAQLTLPSDWCDIAPRDVDCSSHQPVAVKVDQCPLLPFYKLTLVNVLVDCRRFDKFESMSLCNTSTQPSRVAAVLTRTIHKSSRLMIYSLMTCHVVVGA